ncbi:MAG: glycosyltransferase family 2 protein [Fidelibacterota bacterium]
MTKGHSSRDSSGPKRRAELVSVVIPHHNGIDILSECLDSLQACSYSPLEVIVVDNASTDGSARWVRAHHPKVRVVPCEKNLGYAGGCNRGAQEARGTYLLFLNNDTVHRRDWIDWLVLTLQSDSTVGAVQPKILNYFERDRFDFAGGSGGAMDLLCYPFARGRLFLTLEVDKGQYDDEDRIFWASGTAFLVPRSLFLDAGGFDEDFFAHQEEIDLQWRLQLMGYRVFVAPRSVVYHRNAVTLPMDSPRKKSVSHPSGLGGCHRCLCRLSGRPGPHLGHPEIRLLDSHSPGYCYPETAQDTGHQEGERQGHSSRSVQEECCGGLLSVGEEILLRFGH